MSNPLLFNTLAYVKKLEAAGCDHRQAEAHAESLVSIFADQVATKQDIDRLEMNMEARFFQIDAEFNEFKSELKQLNKAIEATNDKMDERAKTLNMLGTMIAIFVGIHSFLPNFHL